MPVSTYDQAKLFTEIFSENSDLGILLLSFLLRINPKQNNIPVTEVIAEFDYSKLSGWDCIPVVVWKNCELMHLSWSFQYMLKICFSETCKVLYEALAFKNVGKRSEAKNFQPVTTSKKWPFFLISSIASSFLVQLQIFRQLLIIEWPGLLTNLDLLEFLDLLIYPSLFTWSF